MTQTVARRLAKLWMQHKIAYDKAWIETRTEDAAYHAVIVNALSVVAARTPILGKAIDTLTQ